MDKWKILEDETPWTEGDAHIAQEYGEPFGATEIFFSIEDEDGELVAKCPWQPLASKEDQKRLTDRARLIAAAPESLAEHRALLHLADTLNARQHAGLEITPTMWGALWDQANRSRAAIAKATGHA